MMEDRLDLIEKIDIFKGVSLSSKLSIVNKLISKTYKLGQQILDAGQIPQGLFVVKRGYCKVGQVKFEPYEISGQDVAWCRSKE